MDLGKVVLQTFAFLCWISTRGTSANLKQQFSEISSLFDGLRVTTKTNQESNLPESVCWEIPDDLL